MWHTPTTAHGLPLSGAEAQQACSGRGARLCRYQELCPNGPQGEGEQKREQKQPAMPDQRSRWLPVIDVLEGGKEALRWVDSSVQAICTMQTTLCEADRKLPWLSSNSTACCEGSFATLGSFPCCGPCCGRPGKTPPPKCPDTLNPHDCTQQSPPPIHPPGPQLGPQSY